AELASTKRKHTVTGPQSLLTGPNTCIQLNWMMFLRRQNRIFTDKSIAYLINRVHISAQYLHKALAPKLHSRV
ncbi:MAG: hypothetical protein ACYCQI_14870, partial [Gammaproteobacteria bacterium]